MPNWGSCTKIQNPKPPSFSPKQNPHSKIILKNLIPNSEEKTHSKIILKNLIPNSEEKIHSKIIRKILCPKLWSQNLDILKSTPKVKNSKFILCGQVVVAVLRSKISNRQVFPQNKIHRKFILKNLIPKLWRKNPQQNYFEKSYARSGAADIRSGTHSRY